MPAPRYGSDGKRINRGLRLDKDGFEISILYGTFSVRKGENLNSETADLKTKVLVSQAPAVL
ncbi:MAG: hypothetical protein ACRC62_12175 [Microcoleus sp.]